MHYTELLASMPAGTYNLWKSVYTGQIYPMETTELLDESKGWQLVGTVTTTKLESKLLDI